MMRTFTLLLFLLGSCQAYSQVRTVSGTLRDTDGSPLPGVNVTVKGTPTGTTTDANGYYSLQAPVGSTVVFAFIGMQTREVKVGPDQFQSVQKIPAQKHLQKPFPSLYATLFKDSAQLNQPGVAVLSDNTPTYSNRANVEPERIKAIRKVGAHYKIIAYDPNPIGGVSGQLTNTISFETINKLPALQNDYAQGRPQGGSLLWQGADAKEIFSWGPLLRTLEYDGSVYPYDRQGRLVTAGTGNGTPASSYDATKIFRTGITTSTELQLTVPTFKNGNASVALENRNRQGILPNSKYARQNASVTLRDVQVSYRTKLQGLLSYNHSTGQLMNRGANLSTIMGSIYRTPPTFDNANGLGSKAALHSTDAYLLADGSARSHAPEKVDNPYGLLNSLPDRETQNRVMANLNLQCTEDPFGYLASVSFEKQQNDIVHGFPLNYAGFADGRLTHRVDNQTLISAMLSPTYQHASHPLKISASYVVNAELRQLERTDGTRFREGDYSLDAAGMLVQMQRTPTRIRHEVSVDLKERYEDYILLKLANRTYFSNTAQTGSYTNFFPTASLSVDLTNKLYMGEIHLLQPYVSLSRALHEAPLVYNNWSYLSTRRALSAYNTFYESTELFFPTGLAPEITRKLETGLRMNAFRFFSFEFSYFNFHTDNFVSPVWRDGHFALANAASISNKGASVTLAYSNSSWRRTYWGVDLKWSTYNNVVDALNTNDSFIALSGFESVASVLAPGQPVGALYGTTFQRNENGEMIIGRDGFPLVDNTLKMIGNPQPDWLLGITSFLNIHQFKLSTTLDFKHGGQTWNGTARVLDYLGKSTTTATLRNTSAYVFEGVNEQGNVNTVPVSFADPSQPVANNRWVRYGWEGVGEEYVQNASWFRMSELSLSYATKRATNRQLIKEAKFTLVSRNLFLVTPYDGVDPSSTLFGYATGSGLDLFNTPSTRSFSAVITLLF